MHTIDEVVEFGWENNYEYDWEKTPRPAPMRADLEGAEIIYAKYQTESYEGDALVIYRKAGKLFVVESSHCSCNGLSWSPSELTDVRGLIDSLYRGQAAVEKALKDAGVL